MLTQPRVLGYVFNPVSFYWCYRADGSLACMVAELNNTFGERLPEVLRGPGPQYEHDKRLHVSPFFGLDQSYEWAFSQPADHVWARIHVRENGARPLTAVLHGRRRELTNASVARSLARYPLMPLQVTALIHLTGAEALAEARAVPPQASVRPRPGLGARMSVVERTLRVAPRARGAAVDRVVQAVLDASSAGSRADRSR